MINSCVPREIWLLLRTEGSSHLAYLFWVLKPYLSVLVRSVCDHPVSLVPWYHRLPAHVEWLGLGQSVWLCRLTADIPLRGARLVLVFSPSRPHLWAQSLLVGSRLCGCFPTGSGLFRIAALMSQIASCVNLGLNVIKAISYVFGRDLGCSQGSLASFFPSKLRGEPPGTNYLLITRRSPLLCSLTGAAFGVSILTLGILCCTAVEGGEHSTKQTVAVLFSLLLRVQWS